MKHFEVRRAIAASPERVWAHLIDAPGLVSGGLFTGVRQFTLTLSGPGTEFHMREEFSGLLAPLIGKSIPDLQPSFEQFADGLLRLSEEKAR